MTGTISTPARCRFVDRLSASRRNRLPTARWALAALPIPSELEIRVTHAGFRLACWQNSKLLANSMPLVCGLHAVCIRLCGRSAPHPGSTVKAWARHPRTGPTSAGAGLMVMALSSMVLDFFPRSVRGRKPTWLASMKQGSQHHVAAVGQVDGQHGATAILHGGRSVVVQLLVVVRLDVAAGETLLPGASRTRYQSTSGLRSARAWGSL